MEEKSGREERVRRACIDAALAAYEDAGVQGLCPEGRWESAVSAMRRLDLPAAIAGPRRGAATQLEAREDPGARGGTAE